jgi:hypothetical protein
MEMTLDELAKKNKGQLKNIGEPIGVVTNTGKRLYFADKNNPFWDMEMMVDLLSQRSFDGFQFKNKEGKVYATIIDSKKWLEATYDSFKSAKNDIGKQCQYNRLKEVYDNFK